ncbi:hypothetical protein LTR85_011739 [Meristemomyces frigidus]|nr:hypothetical protein LTR85_011739 [Meristemomyces frigidus]
MSTGTRRSTRAAAGAATAKILQQSALPKDGSDLFDDDDEVELEPVGFWASRFMKDEPIPSSMADGDLSNDIQALFQQSNFRGVGYKPIMMPARLASRLIQSSALRPMLYTMLNSTPVMLKRRKTGGKRKGRRRYAYTTDADRRQRNIV